jgi:arylsulfatase A-like enzyme
MKTIFIILDSLNRHYLNCYGRKQAMTPNIDRLAERGIVFDNHYSGSLPCMPARREMMTGRLNFMESPWGPVQPWDDCLPSLLRQQKQVYSHIITDHYHYFHSGGEAYHTLFDSWEFIRGQEGDRWRPFVKHPGYPEGTRGTKGAFRQIFWKTKAMMNSEHDEDYSTPQCVIKAMDFLDLNKDEDNWHLHLEMFDPHEPFECPKKYRDMYNDTWDKYYFTWPVYEFLDPEKDDPETVEHIRKCYAGTLTMTDVWLGKLFDKMDQLDMWKDTTVVLTTDHGHLLGEHNCWGKTYMQFYKELAHIPLIVVTPEAAAGRHVRALTATMDIMPTFLDLHGCNAGGKIHGQSLRHLFEKDGAHHDAVLYGTFGKDINLADGTYIYIRHAIPGSTLYEYTAMPRDFFDFIPRDELRSSETGVFLEHTKGIPHYRLKRPSYIPPDAEDFNPIYRIGNIFNNTKDELIHDRQLEKQLADKMKELMLRHDAPECQFKRMGL